VIYKENVSELIFKSTLIALLIGMGLTLKLWLNNRYFPLSPLFEIIPSIPAPFDTVLLFLFALSCIVLLFFKASKWISYTTIALLFIMLLNDINRLQPWVYMYSLLILFYLLVKSQEKKMLFMRILFISVYFYSGWNKLNPHYFNEVINWFIQPFEEWSSVSLHLFFYTVGSLIPVTEIAIGILFLTGKFQKAASISAVIIHLIILLSVGPLGYNYNSAIWPWNIFMILGTYLLFYKSNNSEIWREIKKGLTVKNKIIAAYLLLLPFLNSFNLWPSYLSWNLYSGNTENAQIYLSDRVASYFSPALDEILKECYTSEFVINPKLWAMKEMNCPPFPEKPVWRKVHAYMLNFGKSNNEVILNIQPKTTLLYQPDALTY
jgi:uncharacterized membrane protein YphA (DoxX/SURF4 family)